jgi:hypothetical protein
MGASRGFLFAKPCQAEITANFVRSCPLMSAGVPSCPIHNLSRAEPAKTHAILGRYEHDVCRCLLCAAWSQPVGTVSPDRIRLPGIPRLPSSPCRPMLHTSEPISGKNRNFPEFRFPIPKSASGAKSADRRFSNPLDHAVPGTYAKSKSALADFPPIFRFRFPVFPESFDTGFSFPILTPTRSV